VRAGFAEKCEVQIAYAIGVAQPVSVHVETFGTGTRVPEFLEAYVRDNYDLTPKENHRQSGASGCGL
jgi:S-adenosylmethionine synthetase